jgi:hypothetical protein
MAVVLAARQVPGVAPFPLGRLLDARLCDDRAHMRLRVVSRVLSAAFLRAVSGLARP